MRKLNLDLAELEDCFIASEMQCFLDLETGQITIISQEISDQLEALYDEIDNGAETAAGDLAAILAQDDDLPDWAKQDLLQADRVEAGHGTRYIAIPQEDPHQGYRDMEHFIPTVRDERLRDRLWQAISGRGAFRRFKDVLHDHPGEQERWFAFQAARLRHRVLSWLASEGIEPLVEPAAEQPAPPPPSPRARLIAETLAFVRAAAQLPGVLRIALIGSLATDKADPKDTDLLVTVADDMALDRLATLGRKLQGHLQGINRGADVFLADPHGHYLGRTCPWKRCGPGIRMSCDALHCGRRPYLHDDLEAVRLPDRLIAAPPIELWPRVLARVPAPDDVRQDLMEPLKEA